MSRDHARGRVAPSVGREARLARFQAGVVRTSLLGVPGAVATTSVGLPPVGEVMGAIVQRLGGLGDACAYDSPTRTGYFSGDEPVPQRRTISSNSMFGSRRVEGRLLEKGYETALERLTAEARALGADGVVGVRITTERIGDDVRRFIALGTAVRATGAVHLAEPFVTDLGGADVVKLIGAGWMPVAIAYGVSIGVRHDDDVTRWQSRGLVWNNVEVVGYTELLQRVRADARTRFHDHVRDIGADGALVSAAGVRVWVVRSVREPGHRDHGAEATVFGTAIVKFAQGPTATPHALTILPLRIRGTAQTLGSLP